MTQTKQIGIDLLEGTAKQLSLSIEQLKNIESLREPLGASNSWLLRARQVQQALTELIEEAKKAK